MWERRGGCELWLRVLASESGWMEPVLKQNIGEGRRRGCGGGEHPEATGQRGRRGECPGASDLHVQIRELLDYTKEDLHWGL